MKIFWVTVILVLMVIGFLMSDPVNRLMVLSLEGESHSGSFLGVEIGGETEAMQRRLVSLGFRETSPPQDQSCLLLKAEGDQAITRFVTDDWRNGVVCVLSENGDIRSVSWGFSPVSL